RGGYVMRAWKLGYGMDASDLLPYSGSTITKDFTLSPLPTQSLPDLVIGSTDLTYTVVTSGALRLTAIVYNAGATASNVRVRFYDASLGSGVNQFAAIGDQIIPSLARGALVPMSVSWVPPAGGGPS